jgi:putative DNA primase/helicase
MSDELFIDYDAEDALCGAALSNTAAAATLCDLVKPEDFHQESRARIARVIDTLHRAHAPIDTVIVSNMLAGKVDKTLVHSLPDLCPTATRAATYAGIVAAMARRRRLLELSQRLAATVKANGKPSDELLCEVERLTGEALTRERQDQTDPGRPYGAKTFVIQHRDDVTLSKPVAVIPGRMFRGSLAVIGGRQGDGKGKVKHDLWTSATSGGPWPFGDTRRFKPFTVIDIDAEDDPAEVIFPEYDAAGADLSRLHVVSGREDGLFPNLSDPAQLTQLEQLIGDLHADICSIDPVGHFFPSAKFNETESVIASLSPLMRIAQRTRCVIVPILHFNKGTTTDALAKFLGSGQWTAIARSALAVVEDPDNQDPDSERRQLWTVKCNVVPKRERKPWGFEIVGNENGVAGVRWDATPATTSEAAAFKLEGHRRKSSSDSQQAKAQRWLEGHLADGRSYRAADLYAKAEPEGHPAWAIKKALHGSAEFDQMPVGIGYQKGTTSEWFLVSAFEQRMSEDS